MTNKVLFANIKAKPLLTVLSLLLMALGTALYLSMLFASKGIENHTYKNISGIDLVVGAKGSPLQLVLANVFHIDQATGNINYLEAAKIARNPLVKETLPLAYGDNFKGYRILGTTSAILDWYGLNVEKQYWPEETTEVIVGSRVAQNTGIQVGNQFEGMHGEGEEGHHHDEHPYTVVRILPKTNTVLDGLILSNIEAAWMAHHIAHIHHAAPAQTFMQHYSDSNLEITSLLVKFKNPMAMMQLPRYINKQTAFQAALPQIEVNRLLALSSGAFEMLRWMSLIVLFFALMSLFIALQQIILDRTPQFLMLRLWGAKASEIALLIVKHALILSFAGLVFGLILSFITWHIILLWQVDFPSFAEVFNQQIQHLVLFIILIFGLTLLACIWPVMRIYKLSLHWQSI